jgi:hypothetical protein
VDTFYDCPVCHEDLRAHREPCEIRQEDRQEDFYGAMQELEDELEDFDRTRYILSLIDSLVELFEDEDSN